MERTNLSEQVAAAVIEAVLNGQHTAGGLLPSEADLAREFGVSRPVIREAVRILATKGIVRSEHGRGVVVLENSSRPLLDSLALSTSRLHVSARDVWETRAMVDVGIAEAVARRRTEKDLAQMRAILDRMGHQQQQAGAYEVDADEEFHRALVAAAHNQFVFLLMEPVAQLNRAIARALMADSRNASECETDTVSSRMQRSYAAHERIYEAIVARDGEGAQRALCEHWELAFAAWNTQLTTALDDLAQEGPSAGAEARGDDRTPLAAISLLAE